MIAVHGIPLEEVSGSLAAGAVALSLDEPPRRSRLFSFASAGCEVELRQGSDHIVARTLLSLPREALLDAAIDMAHQALDLTSVEDGNHLATVAPADEHIGLVRELGQAIVWHQSVADLHAGIEANIQGIRPDGTVKPPPPRAVLSWTPAFRFYRLSQGSRDPFDAWRNMFLALEALLDQLFPRTQNKKGRKEREDEWLLRALTEAGAKANLQGLASPGSTNPAKELFSRVYNIRLQLFHAKTGQTLVPQDRASYLAVAKTYPKLVSLWTEIARSWVSLHQHGGGFTHVGFKKMVEGALLGIRLALTADTTPFNETEQTISPKRYPKIDFPSTPVLAEGRPGRVELRGRIETGLLPPGQVIGRVAALYDDGRPALVSVVKGGLLTDGADVFEAVIALRLVNRGLPRTEFS